MTSNRKLFVIPLITFSITFVILVIAIVIIVIVKHDDSTAGEAGSVDTCVVGDWRVTSHSEDVSLDGIGTVTFTGKGAEVHLKADGSGKTDFGDHTRFVATVSGQTIWLDVSGTLTYRFTAINNTVSFSDMSSAATAQTYVDGVVRGTPTPFEGSEDPATYTCGGNTLVEKTSVYHTEFTRM